MSHRPGTVVRDEAPGHTLARRRTLVSERRADPDWRRPGAWVPRRPSEAPDLAPPPRPVPPSSWLLPDPALADPDGVVGLGADLAPGTLVEAYRSGIFPWPHTGVALPWFSPDPRGVLPPDRVHVSRSLRRTLRRCGWTTTIDRAFDAVVDACATERGDDGTWITGEMARAYLRLHRLGWAHSIEVWDGQRLVGGLYGVQVGGVLTGESMFHRATDGSKVAMVDLCWRLDEAGAALLDVQLTTPHLRRMGAEDLSRHGFLQQLHAHRDDAVRLDRRPRPVARLLPDP